MRISTNSRRQFGGCSGLGRDSHSDFHVFCPEEYWVTITYTLLHWVYCWSTLLHCSLQVLLCFCWWSSLEGIFRTWTLCCDCLQCLVVSCSLLDLGFHLCSPLILILECYSVGYEARQFCMLQAQAFPLRLRILYGQQLSSCFHLVCGIHFLCYTESFQSYVLGSWGDFLLSFAWSKFSNRITRASVNLSSLNITS